MFVAETSLCSFKVIDGLLNDGLELDSKRRLSFCHKFFDVGVEREVELELKLKSILRLSQVIKSQK